MDLEHPRGCYTTARNCFSVVSELFTLEVKLINVGYSVGAYQIKYLILLGVLEKAFHLCYEISNIYDDFINPSCPDPGRRDKSKLNFYFNSSL